MNSIFSLQFRHRCSRSPHSFLNHFHLVFKTFYPRLRRIKNWFFPSVPRTSPLRQRLSDCCFVILAQELEGVAHVAITSIASNDWNSHGSFLQNPAVWNLIVEDKLEMLLVLDPPRIQAATANDVRLAKDIFKYQLKSDKAFRFKSFVGINQLFLARLLKVLLKPSARFPSKVNCIVGLHRLTYIFFAYINLKIWLKPLKLLADTSEPDF